MRIYFILLLLLYGCNNSNNNKYIPARYIVIAQEIQDEMAEKLSKKYHMQPFGTVDGLSKCVELLGLSFRIQGPLTQEQLRIIVVGCVQEFLSTINSNEEIKPYLKTYPFMPDSIEINIYVIDYQGRNLYDPNIGAASERRGELMYTIRDRNDHFKYKSIITETYDQALKIVEQTQGR